MYTSIGRRSKYVRTSVYYIEECAAPIASPPTTFYHCDRPVTLATKTRRPVAEFMRESIVFCSTCHGRYLIY